MGVDIINVHCIHIFLKSLSKNKKTIMNPEEIAKEEAG